MTRCSPMNTRQHHGWRARAGTKEVAVKQQCEPTRERRAIKCERCERMRKNYMLAIRPVIGTIPDIYQIQYHE